MKTAISFLALIICSVAFPAANETRDDVDWSKITPITVHVEPINSLRSEFVALPEGRIIGGTETARNNFPFMAACIINYTGFCGCSLIARNRVLTAAHCTIRASIVEIRLGAHNPQMSETTQIRLTSTSIINHADYNATNLSNDIAVIRLNTEITLNNNIQVIPLAPATSGDFATQVALLLGWGRTSDDNASISPVLRQVQVVPINNALCGVIYPGYITDSTLCTWGSNTGVGAVGGCGGDSGGPLIFSGVQIGIVSFTITSCDAGYPTGYTRISSFRTWIQENAGV